MAFSQASNCSMPRAFWWGRPPMTPALQASRTRSGPVTVNIGAQMAGKVSWARRAGSKAMFTS